MHVTYHPAKLLATDVNAAVNGQISRPVQALKNCVDLIDFVSCAGQVYSMAKRLYLTLALAAIAFGTCGAVSMPSSGAFTGTVRTDSSLRGTSEHASWTGPAHRTRH